MNCNEKPKTYTLDIKQNGYILKSYYFGGADGDTWVFETSKNLCCWLALNLRAPLENKEGVDNVNSRQSC